MRLYIECIMVGIVSAICCVISYQIIYYNKLNSNRQTKLINIKLYRKFIKDQTIRNNIIGSFCIGALIHYLISKSNLTNMYCKKVCYDDKCFMVCPI
jgi:hypothetical protein